MSDWPQKFLHAFSERHHYDSVSAAQDELTLDDAYDIQHRFVALRKEPISGYKAALTAPAAQQAMGIDVPIVGVLFADGDYSDADPITLHNQALLETELGFVAAKAIEQTVTPDNVLDFMSHCMSMIEVASPNLATKPNGLDLVATNAASFGYIRGETAAADTALDDLDVRLQEQGETLLSGTGGEVLGGQIEALTWLVNQTLARGYRIEAGHVLMTGSIGGMCPAKSGAYKADFGALGQINFNVVAE
jgi:2-keto-4-pentenoate hydratase